MDIFINLIPIFSGYNLTIHVYGDVVVASVINLAQFLTLPFLIIIVPSSLISFLFFGGGDDV